MKKILGLDLGTNSIGWALVKQDFENKQGEILGMGSRIIPMTQDVLDNFGAGKPSKTQTSERTGYRGTRRLRERHLLRRERLHRVLNIMNFLPEHYANQIDFEKRFGQFKSELEPKLVYNNREFIFKKSFEEMLDDFKKHQPQLLTGKKGKEKLVPYDWTIYYLRKKALTQKIDKQELAWILLNFNQKRGYYQLRGEEDEDATRTAQTRIYFDTQTISKIVDTGIVYKNLKVIQITLSNGDTGKYFAKEVPNWIGVKKNIIATIDLDKEGNDKYEGDGTLKRRFSIPTEEDWDKKWKLVKIKTEKEIKDSVKTVGTYIYDSLLQNPKQKIKGKLVRTIERKFYKEELKAILQKQIELQPELFNEDLYNDCIRELYRNNEAHQLTLSKKDFLHLFLEDIIFYHRPLRSQKSSIGNCSLEYRKYKIDGIEKKEYLKAIPKSNPYYQEFRVWQWLYNLKIYKKEDDTDITYEFIKTQEDLENLFDFLMSQKNVDHKDILKYFFKNLKGKAQNEEISKYRWNYVYDSDKDESKKFPMNETGYEINRRLNKISNIPSNFLTREIEQQLWHLIYSVTDKKEYEKAIESFAEKHHLDISSFVENFKKFPPFKSEYGTFSEKAIKKLLPLLRIGKYWNWNIIDEKTKSRIEKLLTGEFDEQIKIIVREKAEKNKLEKETDFQGLPLWLAQYVVYDRHSEADIAGKWNSVNDLEKYLNDFKQHSLRNPIVEQIVTETLRVVKDIWQQYGNGEKDFFDEIHIELAREMKNTADERKRLTNIVTENENTNLRIKALLIEMINDSEVENVRPYSPIQQEILKIYEDGVLNSNVEVEEEILKISKKAEPTKSELQRYKLWLEQKYRSPYTGQIIPLNKLFTHEYEIEHIIPQSRFFDDSFGNKVICESAVNKLKDNQLGLEFIKNHYGQKVSVELGKEVQIFTEDQYRDFIKENYSKNRNKRNKLLLEEIPEKMIERQLNDTRYISKFISNVLSNIVRNEKDDDGVNSKNVIPLNGKITSELKQDWGLNDVWNDLILPRFERMNQITNSNLYTTYNEKHQKYLPTVPFEQSKGFQKKRIDHRHHALDALIIACATRDHVNLLNNQSAKSEIKRYDLQNKLRHTRKWNDKNGKERDKFTEFKKPWNTFTEDTRNSLETIVVSFKQNLRVINKATNKYEKWVEKNGEKKKELVEQKGLNWAIRQSLHEETVSGIVNLPWVELSEGEITTATRERNDLVTLFKDIKTIDKAENKINKITDTGIQKILINYLESKDNNPELAFSPEGIENLNKNITQFNSGKFHHPIFKVRTYEKGSGRFPLGITGNKKNKYVQGSPNLFFGIYLDEDGNRSFETIRLDKIIERQKKKINPVPEKKTIERKNEIYELNLLFHLSPDDLIYFPTEDEQMNTSLIDFSNLTKEQIERVFFVNDFSNSTCYFRPNHIAKAIIPKEVDMNYNEKKKKITGSFDTKTASFDGNQIKEKCIKLKVDRLGNISKA
ncbi:type II CRISPR RNA-guided endonuclease Cas9 [Flavobacterium sp. NRK F10]|uniref:type II CRISPR RNA-guided endonuclease Cas9 n=1 Tax=Flavobacterium sp. NRK F10 TaxID=2954931 RepID=UPI0020914916|nr:type II CRISPR RNA-guided endonuclease Cas9 [Flavobacterium sp. NRK F10]MCO6173684.1 type II CRISPR RNA-guided endonuclease Cas9 [Flavobacterium sp. NRK F10]